MRNRKPNPPGSILLEEFMEPLGLSKGGLAKLIGVPRRRVHEIVSGDRKLSPDTALRLSKLFRNSPEFWMNLQTQCDLWACHQDLKKQDSYRDIRPVVSEEKSDWG